MKSSVFNSISEEGKQEILDYFENKYNVEVKNASFDMLKEEGLTQSILDHLKVDGKEGVLLMIKDVSFNSENEVVINGLWYMNGLRAMYFKSAIVLKNGEWILKEKIMTGIS
ncbi:hypothetical protein [Oceanirhabdus sp. W0125-5]|uniref:hypothetical protein n=1 Tax=Oceanirhabdus sp. W0125-5 TaxID=2999116 RepID=UPI0022F2B5E1|nr:hypothetical protein [Oceanirhabdus sp. W0125-5]WBW95745.1 hypothetical protein OW730_18885 [Oceanirhabdus sp. W0125-5]